MRRFAFYIIAFILLFEVSLYSQNSYHRVYTVQDGLAQSQVLSICQDKKGQLWIGTAGGGISIYNGIKFTTLSKENGLIGNLVYCVYEDKKGNIWAGTDKGISKISGEKIINFTTENGLPDNTIWKILEDHKGIVWFGTGKGLISYENNTFKLYKDSSGISKTPITALYEDNNNILWVGSKTDGLYKISNNKVKHFSKANGLSNNWVFNIIQDKDNRIVIGTYYGLNTIDNDTVTPHSSYIQTYISTFKCNDGSILISNYFGRIYRFNKFSGINPRLDFSYFLKNTPSIRSIISDNENNIWVGTETGLVQIPSTPFQNWNNNQGLINNNVFSITHGNINDELWFGGYTNGVSLLNRHSQIPFLNIKMFEKERANATKTDKKNLLNYIKNANHGLIGNQVLSIVKDLKNRIWFGTNLGLSVFNSVDSLFFHITNNQEEVDKYKLCFNPKIISNSFNCLYCDSKGNIWGGTQSGVVVFSDTTIIDSITPLNALCKIPVYHILEDSKGNFWFSTKEGLYKFNQLKITKFTEKDGLTEGQITSVVQDNNQNYWIATKEGLYFYNGNKFEKIDESKGLSSNNIYLIINDQASNYLFIGTNKGLDKLNIIKYTKSKIVEIKYYGKYEGFMGLECNRNACYRDKDNNIWFGTVDGVTVYNPLMDKINNIKPQTYITNILHNFKKFEELEKYCDRIDSSTGLPVNLVLPYNINHLTFQFASNSITVPEKVNYMFMMEGVDTSWSPIKSENEAVFPTLPPGKYTFKVKSCNNDGIWNEVSTTFSFEILPPWWLTWWAITIAIVLGLIIIFAYMKYREAALRKDKIRLENTVTERTAEVVHQKEIVEQKNKDITDSIKYAKNIQEALLPTRNEIKKHFPESFMLYKPRDIVSGDFYWISHRANKTYFAVADCTGHGVPGAFMSMLGIAFLDEIIGLNSNVSSNEMLNLMRQNVILSLRQSEVESESKDGMDITLIIVDWDKNELEYSGANNPLYLVRNNYLIEYKADKMPIGVHIKKEPFSKQVIPFSIGDSFYMFSDGYADQFGGPNGKKFKYKTLKDLIVRISNLPMNEQGRILNETIEEWKGDMPQLDDIIISGIHFGKQTLGTF